MYLFPTGVSGRDRFRPTLTIALIVFNAFVFLLEFLYIQANGDAMFDELIRNIAFNVCAVGESPITELGARGFASTFLHANLAHIGGNMWMLWVFGPKVEKYFGRGWFVIFYLVAAYGALIGHTILSGPVVCAIDNEAYVVGASGALAGVLGAFFFLYPAIKINVAVVPAFNFKVPALFFLSFWFIADLLRGVGWFDVEGSNVAHWAHVIGFLVGFAVVFIATMLFKPAPKADPFAYLDE